VAHSLARRNLGRGQRGEKRREPKERSPREADYHTRKGKVTIADPHGKGRMRGKGPEKEMAGARASWGGGPA